MLTMFRASRSNIVVWIILGLLIVGLAGFGISTGGSGGRSVAQVGETRIEADALARALDQELRAITQQIGRALPMAEARQFGVDRMVLARLINDATLDDEARRIGLSTGDATVQDIVLATPAFRGTDGAFNRDAYIFALERGGLTPGAFEELLRAEATRELIAGSLQSAVHVPDAAVSTLLGYIGETRRIAWLPLDAGLLQEPVPAPSQADLEAQYAAEPDRYMRPETRRLTYALLSPEALAAATSVPEAALRAAYDAAAARYDIPERRIVDRIGFGTAEEAAEALARIEAGETDFDAVATARGLTPAEIDQGALNRSALATEAAEAVFGAAEPGIVGPVPTPLGPSLYRINAILAARVTPFEEARAELAEAEALALARAEVEAAAGPAADLLAGGGRLEDLVAEAGFALATLDLQEATTGGVADDPAFRAAALAAEPGIESDLVELDSGGLAALRLEAVEPPAPIPLAEITETVAADWTLAETDRRLAAFAASLEAELAGGLAFGDLAARLGRTLLTPDPLGRADRVPEGPAGLVEAVFAAAEGDIRVVSEPGRIALVQVTEVVPVDPAAPDIAALSASMTEELRGQTAEDLLGLFLQALQTEAGLRVDQTLYEQVLAQFP